MFKKAIIIASAVIAILYALRITWGQIHDGINGEILLPALIILISILVIFNIRLPLILRIPLIVASILPVLFCVRALILLAFFIHGLFVLPDYEDKVIGISLIIMNVAVMITLITYIIWALSPSKPKETKIGMNRTVLIVIGILCALLTAAGVMWYNYKDPINVARRRLKEPNRSAARVALFKLGKQEGSSRIIKLLQDNDPEMRCAALDALGLLCDKKAITDITRLLNDNDFYVRQTAILKLYELDAKISIPEIKKHLNNEYTIIRDYAEKALKKLGVPDSEIEQAKQK